MDSHDQQNAATEGSATVNDGLQQAAHADTRAQTNELEETHRYLSRDRHPSHLRRLAIALGGLGVLAIGGGIVFADARELLFAFGATGLFGSVLTYSVTLGRFVDASVTERIYAPLAANGEALGDAIGLQPWTRGEYVPVGDDESIRLFVPARSTLALDQATLDRLVDSDDPFVEGDGGGVLLEPTGAALFQEFERRASIPPTADPSTLVPQLAEAVTEQFELARNATADVDDGSAVVEVVDSTLGRVDRFDHPIPSFLAVGLVTGISRPVTVDVDRGENGNRWVVTCRWEPSESVD